MEPYARPANDAVFDALGVAAGTRLLDIACGSGFAAMVAAKRGAIVAGLDASESLIEIARCRTPEGDFQVGDMFPLPFAAHSFDAASSFNGIWAGCEQALVEAVRVVRPGGTVGISFWGSSKRMGLLPYFFTVAALSPPDHVQATLGQARLKPVAPALPRRCSTRLASRCCVGGRSASSTNGRTWTSLSVRWRLPGRLGQRSPPPVMTPSPVNSEKR